MHADKKCEHAGRSVPVEEIRFSAFAFALVLQGHLLLKPFEDLSINKFLGSNWGNRAR